MWYFIKAGGEWYNCLFMYQMMFIYIVSFFLRFIPLFFTCVPILYCVNKYIILSLPCLLWFGSSIWNITWDPGPLRSYVASLCAYNYCFLSQPLYAWRGPCPKSSRYDPWPINFIKGTDTARLYAGWHGLQGGYTMQRFSELRPTTNHLS